MGTQQILLIVLSVIIVAVAVSVGITMFNVQSVNSNRSACVADMNNFAASALAWYKTPTSHGGHGNAAVASTDADDIGAWIGFPYDSGTSTITTGNGTYVIAPDADKLVFTATGTSDGVNPVLTLTWATGGVGTVANPS